MNSYDELIKALSLLEPIKKVEIEYRLHYNDQGHITMGTMVQHPDNTQYLVVTEEEYKNFFKYQVINKELSLIRLDKGFIEPISKDLLKKTSAPKHAAILFDKHADSNFRNF